MQALISSAPAVIFSAWISVVFGMIGCEKQQFLTQIAVKMDILRQKRLRCAEIYGIVERMHGWCSRIKPDETGISQKMN